MFNARITFIMPRPAQTNEAKAREGDVQTGTEARAGAGAEVAEVDTHATDLFAASAAESALPASSKPPESVRATGVRERRASDAVPNTRPESKSEPGHQPDSKAEAEAERNAPSSAAAPSPSPPPPPLAGGGSDTSVSVSASAGEATALPQTKEELVEEALNCPCIASMKEGSCGAPFIAAYRCFLESETKPKGMDCMEHFKSMQACIAEHPDEYNMDDEDDPDADPFAPSRAADAPSDPTPVSKDAPATASPHDCRSPVPAEPAAASAPPPPA